jgi:hypothetical protein
LSSSLTAQTKYPYELIKGKDTTVTLLKSQAVYLNQTIAKQKAKINEIKTEYDSTKAEYAILDSSFNELHTYAGQKSAKVTELDSIIRNQKPVIKIDTVVITKEIQVPSLPPVKGLSRWGMSFSRGSLNSFSDLRSESIEAIEGSTQALTYSPDKHWEARGILTQGTIRGIRTTPIEGTQIFGATLYSAELVLAYNFVVGEDGNITVFGGNGFAHSHRYLTSASNPNYPLLEINSAGGVWTIFTTLGGEVGINLTKSVTALGGIKVNVYSTDDLDAWASYDKGGPDIIQYTYAGLAFRFSK